MNIKTNRLTICKFTENDAAFIIELLNTEGFLTMIGDRNVRDEISARKYIQERLIGSYKTNGYGLYAVRLKDTQKLIGMSGLVKRDVFKDPDIGFAFLPQHFGKGYAKEAGKAVLEYARNYLQIKKVLGITKKENEASQKVLLSLGLSYEGPFRLHPEEEDGNLYSIQLLP